MPDWLQVSDVCAIDRAEFAWKFAPSGGPGGQHANKSSTRVELTFDVAESPSLSEAQRARLIERLGSTIRVAADDERSQFRNRAAAANRLRKRLADALFEETPRRPTRPSRGAKERRLTDKHRRSTQKQARRRAIDD